MFVQKVSIIFLLVFHLVFSWPDYQWQHELIFSVCLFSVQLVKLGIKLLMLLQARSLISSGQLTVGTLVSFFLYQKPMSRSLTVSSAYLAAPSCVFKF